MSLANRFVAAILRSPLHRVLSGSTALVRYAGRRTGATVVTPVQYARSRAGVVVLVGQPAAKTWWRNFERERDAELLLQGRWHPFRARAIVGRREPGAAEPLVGAYFSRFPHAMRTVEGNTRDERIRNAVIVWFRNPGRV